MFEILISFWSVWHAAQNQMYQHALSKCLSVSHWWNRSSKALHLWNTINYTGAENCHCGRNYMAVHDEAASLGKLMFGATLTWLKVCGLFRDYRPNICFWISVTISSGDQSKEANADYRFKTKLDVVKRKDYSISPNHICFQNILKPWKISKTGFIVYEF